MRELDNVIKKTYRDWKVLSVHGEDSPGFYEHKKSGRVALCYRWQSKAKINEKKVRSKINSYRSYKGIKIDLLILISDSGFTVSGKEPTRSKSLVLIGNGEPCKMRGIQDSDVPLLEIILSFLSSPTDESSEETSEEFSESVDTYEEDFWNFRLLDDVIKETHHDWTVLGVHGKYSPGFYKHKKSGRVALCYRWQSKAKINEKKVRSKINSYRSYKGIKIDLLILISDSGFTVSGKEPTRSKSLVLIGNGDFCKKIGIQDTDTQFLSSLLMYFRKEIELKDYFEIEEEDSEQIPFHEPLATSTHKNSITHVQTLSLSRNTVQFTSDCHSLDVLKEIIKTLPPPIVDVLTKVHNADNNDEQLKKSFDALEIFMRYLIGLLLPIYLKGNQKNNQIEAYLTKFDKPSSGGYQQFLHHLLREIGKRKEPFFATIVAWHFDQFDQSYKERKPATQLKALVQLRNKYTHRSDFSSTQLENLKKDVLSTLVDLLKNAKWLTNFKVFYVHSVQNTKQGSVYTIKYLDSPLTENKLLAARLYNGIFYVENLERASFLELSPFFGFDEKMYIWKLIDSDQLLSDGDKVLPLEVQGRTLSWTEFLNSRNSLEGEVLNSSS